MMTAPGSLELARRRGCVYLPRAEKLPAGNDERPGKGLAPAAALHLRPGATSPLVYNRCRCCGQGPLGYLLARVRSAVAALCAASAEIVVRVISGEARTPTLCRARLV